MAIRYQLTRRAVEPNPYPAYGGGVSTDPKEIDHIVLTVELTPEEWTAVKCAVLTAPEVY